MIKSSWADITHLISDAAHQEWKSKTFKEIAAFKFSDNDQYINPDQK